MKGLRNRKGQNMVEYLVIIGAVIIVIVGLANIFSGHVQTGMTNLSTQVGTEMSNLGR